MKQTVRSPKTLESISKSVRTLLTERFSEAAISDVVIKFDSDLDGDNVLTIFVILAINEKKALDSRKMVGLVRHLRSSLESKKIEEFPIVSFVSKKEASKLLEAI